MYFRKFFSVTHKSCNIHVYSSIIFINSIAVLSLSLLKAAGKDLSSRLHVCSLARLLRCWANSMSFTGLVCLLSGHIVKIFIFLSDFIYHLLNFSEKKSI